MDAVMALEVVAVVGAWTVLGLSIWRWGPGQRKRRVRCPTEGVRAKVVVEQREGDFGTLRVTDVTACSLFPNERLACDKKCLTRF